MFFSLNETISNCDAVVSCGIHVSIRLCSCIEYAHIFERWSYVSVVVKFSCVNHDSKGNTQSVESVHICSSLFLFKLHVDFTATDCM